MKGLDAWINDIPEPKGDNEPMVLDYTDEEDTRHCKIVSCDYEGPYDDEELVAVYDEDGNEIDINLLKKHYDVELNPVPWKYDPEQGRSRYFFEEVPVQ